MMAACTSYPVAGTSRRRNLNLVEGLDGPRNIPSRARFAGGPFLLAAPSAQSRGGRCVQKRAQRLRRGKRGRLLVRSSQPLHPLFPGDQRSRRAEQHACAETASENRGFRSRAIEEAPGGTVSLSDLCPTTSSAADSGFSRFCAHHPPRNGAEGGVRRKGVEIPSNAAVEGGASVKMLQGAGEGIATCPQTAQSAALSCTSSKAKAVSSLLAAAVSSGVVTVSTLPEADFGKLLHGEAVPNVSHETGGDDSAYTSSADEDAFPDSFVNGLYLNTPNSARNIPAEKLSTNNSSLVTSRDRIRKKKAPRRSCGGRCSYSACGPSHKTAGGTARAASGYGDDAATLVDASFNNRGFAGDGWKILETLGECQCTFHTGGRTYVQTSTVVKRRRRKRRKRKKRCAFCRQQSKALAASRKRAQPPKPTCICHRAAQVHFDRAPYDTQPYPLPPSASKKAVRPPEKQVAAPRSRGCCQCSGVKPRLKRSKPGGSSEKALLKLLSDFPDDFMIVSKESSLGVQPTGKLVCCSPGEPVCQCKCIPPSTFTPGERHELEEQNTLCERCDCKPCAVCGSHDCKTCAVCGRHECRICSIGDCQACKSCCHDPPGHADHDTAPVARASQDAWTSSNEVVEVSGDRNNVTPVIEVIVESEGEAEAGSGSGSKNEREDDQVSHSVSERGEELSTDNISPNRPVTADSFTCACSPCGARFHGAGFKYQIVACKCKSCSAPRKDCSAQTVDIGTTASNVFVASGGAGYQRHRPSCKHYRRRCKILPDKSDGRLSVSKCCTKGRNQQDGVWCESYVYKPDSAWAREGGFQYETEVGVACTCAYSTHSVLSDGADGISYRADGVDLSNISVHKDVSHDCYQCH